MKHSSRELEEFKTEIPLADYLAIRWGFEFDARASCLGSVVMRHPDGRKLIVARGHDLHQIYFNVHDAADNGTIIDFLLTSMGPGATLGHVRKELREFMTGSPRPTTPIPEIRPIEHNLLQVRSRFAGYERISAEHPYLTEERGIPPALLAHPRFRDRIREDEVGRASFPHFGVDGDLCGYEIVAHQWKQFSSGGTKGLWLSESFEGDAGLVVAESAIDALSYAALHGCNRMQFASICGRMNKTQPALLTQMIGILPAGSKVTAAFDHDEAGFKLAEELKSLIFASGCPKIAFEIQVPPNTGQDWNDVVRGSLPGPTLD